MNERDGHDMLVARCQALEKIALECFEELTHVSTSVCKQRLERAIEELAPGCGHLNQEF